MCNDDGTCLDKDNKLVTGPYQTAIRETLSWIPLKEGWDYSTNPPTDNTISNGQSDEEAIKPPMAWVYDEVPDAGGSASYIACDHAGMHAHHPYHDWGIVVTAHPPHKLARHQLADDDLVTFDITEEELRFDYETLVATIAIESDWRINLKYTVPDTLAAGDGSVMTIVDEEAELWVLLPNTVVEVNTNWSPTPRPIDQVSATSSPGPQVDTSQFIKSGAKPMILRNDIARLAFVMAGAQSRYINQRGRAQLTLNGLFPYANLIGYLLKAVQQGDSIQPISAVISSVEWILEPTPKTIIRTGYA